MDTEAAGKALTGVPPLWSTWISETHACNDPDTVIPAFLLPEVGSALKWQRAPPLILKQPGSRISGTFVSRIQSILPAQDWWSFFRGAAKALASGWRSRVLRDLGNE